MNIDALKKLWSVEEAEKNQQLNDRIVELERENELLRNLRND